MVMEIKEQMESLATRRDLDTQDLTEIASYLLTQRGVAHSMMCGSILIGGTYDDKYWIETEDGYVIDFRTIGTPSGIFKPSDAKHITYIGEEVQGSVNSVRFEILTGECPSEFLP